MRCRQLSLLLALAPVTSLTVTSAAHHPMTRSSYRSAQLMAMGERTLI